MNTQNCAYGRNKVYRMISKFQTFQASSSMENSDSSEVDEFGLKNGQIVIFSFKVL